MEDAYSKAFQAFKEFKETHYIKYKTEDLSESDTRSKILDFIFINILDWSELDIVREPKVESGYIDYLFSTASFKFVVEAKRQFKEFKLPSRSNQTNFKAIYAQNKEVIDQIRSYLVSKSLSIGIITNGSQFIIGKLINSDGEDWKNNICIYYKNLDDIEENFYKFYELLSKEFIARNGRIKLVEPQKKSFNVVKELDLKNKENKLVRNEISAKLIPIIGMVFEEIYKTENLDQKSILEQCYVHNHNIKKFNYELGNIFADLPPTFHENIAKVQDTKNTQAQISEDLMSANSSFTPDPIVLIGTAGAGKTTFIKNFVDVELDSDIKKVRPIVYIDFRDYTSQQITDTKFIYDEIINNLVTNYDSLNLNEKNILKTIYREDINEKKKVEWSYIEIEKELEKEVSIFLGKCKEDKVNHLKKISHYLLYQCRKRLCVVFDNVDQLNDDEQTEAFLLAQSINRYLNSIVIISLREGYYYKWKDKPPINAYQSTVYHITAPPYREVLQKRIQFVLNNIKFDPIKIELNNKTVGFAEGSLAILFRNIYNSLFKKQNSQVLRFLEETSYPNIREGLNLFKTFLLSAHTKVSDYMAMEYSIGEKAGIPFWEFLKSVALDASYYYSTDNSKIFNLFNPSIGNSNHFTKIRILQMLKKIASSNTKQLTFVRVQKVIEEFSKIGYTGDIIKEELQVLLENKLITTPEYFTDVREEIRINKDNNIAISSTGNYYYTILISEFTYFDLILQDTPIYSESYFKKIVSRFPHADDRGNRDLLERVNTVEMFLDYLEEKEKSDLNKIEERDANYLDSESMIKFIREEMGKQTSRIRNRIK